MDWKLQLVVVPVSDVDASKAFYLEQMGFGLIVDHQPNEHFRVVQLNPPGSSCAIAIGVGMGDMVPGSLRGLHLVVNDIEAAHRELVERGATPSAPYWFSMTGERTDGVQAEHEDYATFMDLTDPDGNVWMIQEVGHAEAGA